MNQLLSQRTLKRCFVVLPIVAGLLGAIKFFVDAIFEQDLSLLRLSFYVGAAAYVVFSPCLVAALFALIGEIILLAVRRERTRQFVTWAAIITGVSCGLATGVAVFVVLILDGWDGTDLFQKQALAAVGILALIIAAWWAHEPKGKPRPPSDDAA